MDNGEQPLLSTTNYDSDHLIEPKHTSLISPSLTFDEEDIGPITGVQDFFRKFFVESKKLWYLAGPAIFTSVSQYTIGAITQVFAGQLGTIQLAAISEENSVIAGFAYGIMMGMGSALETLCGQAYGAGQLDMLGIYMQRSWVILNAAALVTMQIYIFGASILKLLGQTTEISKAAGTFALWMIPQLFAYATMLPLAKFLQAQSKVMVMALIAVVALGLHSFFSWLLMLKLGWGLVGAALVLNSSWWFIALAQLWYVFSGCCGRTWSGFSMKAFQNLWGFFKLSLASAVMLCLEIWYIMAIVIFAGFLKNAEVSVDAISICINILGWTSMVSMGLNVAISVRVSNELGSARPRSAKFSVLVVGITSLLLGIFLALILIIFRKQYPALFSSSTEVKQLVNELTPLLGVSIVVTNVQYALCGVAIGAGWQGYVAFVSSVCYFIFGVPLGVLLAYRFNMGAKGIWVGMVSGISLQCCLLFLIVYRTNWNKETCVAGDRIKQWGSQPDAANENDVERIDRHQEQH